MRTNKTRHVATDHDLSQGQAADDHHSPGELFRLLVNSLSIAPGLHEERVTLAASDLQTCFAVLRGPSQTDIQGHEGAVVFGTATAGECSAQGLKAYGGGGYTTSYMGGYSRLHGDSYLTHNMFGPNIRLRDFYLDGDEIVFEFANISGSNQTLTVYASGVAK